MKSKKVWFLVLVCSGVVLWQVFDFIPPFVKRGAGEILNKPAEILESLPAYAEASVGKPTSLQILMSKVLLTAEEKAQLQAELSNPELIRKSYLALTDITSHERVRFQALDYFEKAIAWQENPAHEQVIDSLRNVMLLDNLLSIEDMAVRKSYAGDKIEVYAILKQYAPEELEIINTLPEDGRIRKLLAYAENLAKF